jgi:hypothetical protein
VLVRVRQEVQALLWQPHAALTAKALLESQHTGGVFFELDATRSGDAKSQSQIEAHPFDLRELADSGKGRDPSSG